MYKVFYKEYFEELAILGFDNHSELVDFVNDIACDDNIEWYQVYEKIDNM